MQDCSDMYNKCPYKNGTALEATIAGYHEGIISVSYQYFMS